MAVDEDKARVLSDEPDLASQPIDLLVELAEEGEIDPWNVDVVKVTDRFLDRVDAIDRKGLKVLGETLLCAAVLVRMKSEALVEEDEDEGYGFQEWEPAPMNPLWQDPPELEPPVRREAPRPATLPELIDELERAVHRCELREERERASEEAERRSEEEVKEVPHEEKIEQRILEIAERLEEPFDEGEEVSLDGLSEPEKPRVQSFVPLLFMEARGFVELEQQELYAEVSVVPGEEPLEEVEEMEGPEPIEGEPEEDEETVNPEEPEREERE